MSIETHHPNKWRIIDIETGEVYKWNMKRSGWVKVTEGMLAAFVQSVLTNFVRGGDEPVPDNAGVHSD